MPALASKAVERLEMGQQTGKSSVRPPRPDWTTRVNPVRHNYRGFVRGWRFRTFRRLGGEMGPEQTWRG